MFFNELAGRLSNAIPGQPDDPAEEVSRQLVQVVRFAQELVYFESVEMLLSHLLPGTDLGKKVAPELADLLPSNIEVFEGQRESVQSSEQSSTTLLERIATQANQLEFAESNEQLGLLAMPPLDALVSTSAERLPSAVVLGAKGSGKTFAWGQMALAQAWPRFVSAVNAELTTVAEANVFPLLRPAHTAPGVTGKVREAEEKVWHSLGLGRSPLTQDDFSTKLRAGLQVGADALAFWTACITDRLGLPLECGASVEALIEGLRVRNSKIVLAIDGLEDVFQHSLDNPLSEGQRELLRGLLTRFVPSIQEFGGKTLGVVTFVRPDLAELVLPQNFQQFQSLHKKFSLAWSPTEALRLVVWLVHRAGRALLDTSRIPWAAYDELRNALIQFWGERLGSPRSREARTDRWVIAVLSDFQGRLQARDVVRLIGLAARDIQRGESLPPSSLRRALVDCSSVKLQELQTEILDLVPIFKRFLAVPIEDRAMPFKAETFELTPVELNLLERHGIVTELDECDLYMPEIMRHGLGFRQTGGRRAKVLALYRATQGRR